MKKRIKTIIIILIIINVILIGLIFATAWKVKEADADKDIDKEENSSITVTDVWDEENKELTINVTKINEKESDVEDYVIKIVTKEEVGDEYGRGSYFTYEPYK